MPCPPKVLMMIAMATACGTPDPEPDTTSDSEPPADTGPDWSCAEGLEDILVHGTETAATVSVRSQVEPLAAADMNGDGLTDLVAGSNKGDEGTITIVLGREEPGFEDPLPFQGVCDQPEDIEPADLDGDGHTDLLLACQDDHVVLFFEGTGDGGIDFGDAWLQVTKPEALALADLDGDGLLDLVAGGSAGVTVGFGEAEGPPTELLGPVGCEQVGDVAIADLNEDGWLDILASCETDAAILLLTGEGRRNFGDPVQLGGLTIGTSEIEGLQLADLDQDGDQDVLTVIEGVTQDLVLLLNEGAGSAWTELHVSRDGRPTALMVGDADSDGDPDVFVAADDGVQIFEGLPSTEDLLADRGTVSAAYAPMGMLLADLDDQCHPDLVVADKGAARLRILYSYEQAEAEDPKVRLNEIMPRNQTALEIPDYGTPDWLEIVNTREATLDLEGWWISDKLWPHRHQLGAGLEIAPGERLLLYASDEDQDEAEADQLGFALEGSGEQLSLHRPDGVLVDRVSWEDAESDFSLARQPDATGEWAWTDSPTPGEAND